MRPSARKNVHFAICAPGRATLQTYLSSSGKGETSVLPCWPPAYSGLGPELVEFLIAQGLCDVVSDPGCPRSAFRTQQSVPGNLVSS